MADSHHNPHSDSTQPPGKVAPGGHDDYDEDGELLPVTPEEFSATDRFDEFRYLYEQLTRLRCRFARLQGEATGDRFCAAADGAQAEQADLEAFNAVADDATDITVDQYSALYARWVDLRARVSEVRAFLAGEAIAKAAERERIAALEAKLDTTTDPVERKAIYAETRGDREPSGVFVAPTAEQRAASDQRRLIIATVPALSALEARVDALCEAGGDWGSAMAALDAEVKRYRIVGDKVGTAEGLRAAGLVTTPTEEDAAQSREASLQALAQADAGTAFPAPFRGAMAAAVEAALVAAYKPQPALTTLATLIGMAACLPGHYRLPDGGRMNLYGLGALETGGGKDAPRKVAIAIAKNADASVIGGPASGQALEDALDASHPMLVEVDEVAHVLSAMAGSTAPAYTIELGRRLLALFSASNGTYHCRARAAAKQSFAGSPPRSLTNPCVSFLGFATPGKLGEALTVGNIEDGLLGRMLFAFGEGGVTQRRVSVAFALPKEFERFRTCFDQALAMITPQTGINVIVGYGPGADAMHDALLVEFSGPSNGGSFSGALAARAVEKILRVAGVLACFDNPNEPVLTVEHLDWAAQLVRASNRSIGEFVGEHMHGGIVQADAARVLGLIDRIVAGQVGVQTTGQLKVVRAGLAPRSSLLKQSKLDKRRFDEAVAHLLGTGDAEAATVTADAGRTIPGLRRATE